MMEYAGNKKANASPTKEFFVDMITRDITLEDSILDLIDNSVDAAWRSAGSHIMSFQDNTDLSEYVISIDVSADIFSIRDNCGGMSLDDAVNHAFSFGRRSSESHKEYSIGVYGIGMKRAVFKLGREIRIRSTFSENDGSTLAFAVPIDVENWLEKTDPHWDFDIDDDQNLEKKGVEVIVRKLTNTAKTSFGNPVFVENLRRMIARDYLLYLNRGLNITVCGRRVTGIEIKLRQSDEFIPLRINYQEIQNNEQVFVEIFGGMAAPPPDSREPDEKSDSDKRFGWYVACNGRVVLAADKTSVSGWGTPSWPQWHGQYAGFLGIVLFSAPNTATLPLTTTKRSVDSTSEIYRRAQITMRDLSKDWIAYTNIRKQALDEAKKKEALANAVPIQDIGIRNRIALPELARKMPELAANVHYSVPLRKMTKLAKKFGSINMSYREVGLKSFKHAYDDFVGDE